MQAEIYKIVPEQLWRDAQAQGVFLGAPVDLADGFIHFSAGEQVEETATKHFAGQDQLMLVAVDPADLGDTLRWEVSRGGARFPHLYAPLSLTSVRSVTPLPLGPDGRHVFDGLLP